MNLSASPFKMKFGNGEVTNFMAEYFTDRPPIPGPVSPWTLMQWGKAEYIDPAVMLLNDPSTRDPGLFNAD